MIEKSRPPFYHKPPVIERVASIYADMSEEHFESRFDAWRDKVQAEFPIYEPLKEWLILVEEREGIPLLNTARPELRITPRFSRKPSRDGFDWSIRCPTGQFTMNMHSMPGQGQHRRYDHLRSEFARWLPAWMNHFEVSKPKILTLHYVNLLDRETVPQFCHENNHLFLDRIVTVFTNIPGEHECLLPPYECQVNVKLADRPESTMLIKLEGGGYADGSPAIKLRLLVQTSMGDHLATADELLHLLDWEHEHILSRFEAVFTPEARESFEPANP